MTTMIDQPSETESPPGPTTKPEVSPTKQLILGAVFGLVFGFLLQKGGVAKFHILIGQLLLADYTVVKVMLSAVVVGSLGIHFMHRAGLVELHIKPTRYASNVIGGLLFGVGFAFSAYCPGTGAAALGQGNYDALCMIVGMIAGSYLFAEMSGWIGRHIDPIGDRGKMTFRDLLPFHPTVITVGSATILIAILVGVEVLTVR